MMMAGWLVVLAAATDISPPASGTWVVDSTGQISAETKRQVDELANEVNVERLAQIAVLVIDKVEGEGTPREFATDVFNHWKLGRGGVNDGILVMIAIESRKAEIVLGTGRPLSEAQTDEVMRDDIVANMRRDDVNAAVLASVRGLHERLNDIDRVLECYVKGSPFPTNGAVTDLANALTEEEERSFPCDMTNCAVLVVNSNSKSPWIGELAEALQVQTKARTIIALNVGRNEALVVPSIAPDSSHQKGLVRDAARSLASGAAPVADRIRSALAFTTSVEQQGYSFDVESLVMTLGALLFMCCVLGVFGFLGYRRMKRLDPWNCKKCQTPRRLLSEQDEDAHLSSRQQAEENSKAFEYDVWWCGRCNDAVVKRWFGTASNVKMCPKCGAHAIELTPQETTSRTEVIAHCGHCAYAHTWTWYPSDNGSSDSSSSSSDSGGSSDGGGSSGSW